MQPQYYNNDELMHYGVIGMKWGVRRASKQLSSATTKEAKSKAKASLDKHYEKASKKLNRHVKKAEKHLAKAQKQSIKADNRWFNRDAYRELAAKQSRKASRQMYKAQKWVKQMDKAFANSPIKVSKEQQEIGRRYADMLSTRALNASYR